MRARFAFLVAAAVVIAVASRGARAQDLGAPFQRAARGAEARAQADEAAHDHASRRARVPARGAGRASCPPTSRCWSTSTPTGKVTKVDRARSPVGHGFDEAAHDAVMQYVFSPAEVDGKPAADPDRVHAALRAQAGAARVARRRRAPTPPSPAAAPAAAAPGRRSSRAAACARRARATRCTDAEVSVIVRTPEGAEKPAVVVGGTDDDGRFEVKGQPGVGAARDRRRAAPRPCIRDLTPRTSERRQAQRDRLPRRRSAGAPPTRRPSARAAHAGGHALHAGAARAHRRARHVRRSAARRAEPARRRAHAVRPRRCWSSAAPRPTTRASTSRATKIPILYHFLGGPGVLTPAPDQPASTSSRATSACSYGRVTAGVVDVGIRTDAGAAPARHGRHQPARTRRPTSRGRWAAAGRDRSRRGGRTSICCCRSCCPSNVVTAAPVYWDYQAGVHRDVAGGQLSLFAFGSNDTLKVISKDPRQGNLDSRHRDRVPQGASPSGRRRWATGSTSSRPRTATSSSRFGAGALAINQSAARRSSCATSCRASSAEH